MTAYAQNAFNSFVITPTNYVFGALNDAYENTPLLKKTCEVSGRFFYSLLKKPKDLVKGIEALGKCILLTLENKELMQKVSIVVKKAGKCKGWLTLVGLPNQISNALNLTSSNVVSFKSGDTLVLGEKVILLTAGSALRLTGQAPSFITNTEYEVQNGVFIKLGSQAPNKAVSRILTENGVKLHLGNEIFLLPNGTRFQVKNSFRKEAELREGKDIFQKASFRISLSAWTGLYSGVFESIKFLKITKILSVQNPCLQIGNMLAIITGAFARLGDDHKQYQTKGLSLENITSVVGNISVFMLGTISLANKKGLCGPSPKIMFFCSTVATLTNLSSHFLKSINPPTCRNINDLLLT